ncbi:unnamed protein product, partial [Brassica rapa]
KSCAGENFICLTTAAFFSFSFAQLESSKKFIFPLHLIIVFSNNHVDHIVF